jgi:hypothetical protein
MSLDFYEELQTELEEESRDDPATQAELAAAYAQVGELTERVGTRARALERARSTALSRRVACNICRLKRPGFRTE